MSRTGIVLLRVLAGVLWLAFLAVLILWLLHETGQINRPGLEPLSALISVAITSVGGLLSWLAARRMEQTAAQQVIQQRKGALATGEHATAIQIEKDNQAPIAVGSNITISHIVNQYHSASGPPLFDDAAFTTALRNYLAWVFNRYGRLTLRGLERRESGILTLDLEEIYISLAAVVNPEQDERKRLRQRPGRHDDKLSDVAAEERRVEPVDMGQLLAFGPHLAITGGPGSGKSTYLHLLASSLAQGLLAADPTPVRKQLGLQGPLPLPILVSLGGYNRYRKQTAGDRESRKGTLIDYLSHALIRQNAAIGLPADFFERLLVRGEHCILLLDGLDEVAEERDREIVSQKLAELAGNAAIGHILVTSRTRAYEGNVSLPHFRVAAVQPMTPEQVNSLAARWCSAAYDADEAAREIPRLQGEIHRLEALRELRGQPRLIETPLLTTIIAIVHDNQRRLPEQRAALYEECVKALLSEHMKPATEEKIQLVDWGGTLNEKRNLLAFLAYEMMSAGEKAGRVVEEGQVKTWLRPLVVRDHGEQLVGQRLEAFTTAMRERGSLLDEQDGTYRFTHLTFQEFLAATYLADTIGEADQIARFLAAGGRLADAWWRETVLLTAGYMGLRGPARALKLLGRLATLPLEQGELALAAAELAGTALLELDSHDAETRKAITGRLATLLTDSQLALSPPLRALAGEALGRLGDPRPDVTCDIPFMVDDIPAGPFWMGSDKQKDDLADDDETVEGKAHQVTLPAYRIGRYPVTVAQYRRFWKADGYENKDNWTAAGWDWRRKNNVSQPELWDDPRWTVDNHPVIGVSWYEAVAYCKWLKATNGRAFRLPDEAMWEKAARGTDGRRWPWGNDLDANKLNSRDSGIERTSAVGIFPAGKSPFGVYDAAGNVLEWCSNPGYSVLNYPFKPRPYEKDLTGDEPRALRGGAWYGYEQDTRAAYRFSNDPDFGLNNVGFRVAEHLSDPDS
jgi:formylglycine-generating enzyme required for sulfatase activity